MEAAIRLGRPRYAVNVWLEMRRQFYGDSSHRLPRLVVKALGQLGAQKALYKLHKTGFDQESKQKLHSQALTRCIVLALGQAGALDLAREVAASLGDTPHTQLVTLAHAHAQGGDLEGAYGIAEELKASDLSPGATWATAMVSGVRTEKDVAFAIKAIETLILSGVPPDDKQLVSEFQRLSERLGGIEGAGGPKMVAIEAVMTSLADGMRTGTSGAIGRLGGMRLGAKRQPLGDSNEVK